VVKPALASLVERGAWTSVVRAVGCSVMLAGRTDATGGGSGTSLRIKGLIAVPPSAITSWHANKNSALLILSTGGWVFALDQMFIRIDRGNAHRPSTAAAAPAPRYPSYHPTTMGTTTNHGTMRADAVEMRQVDEAIPGNAQQKCLQESKIE